MIGCTGYGSREHRLRRLTPRTTIVIPVWGDYGGQPLTEALATLRDQDREARVLVVDNASKPSVGELTGADVERSPRRLSAGAARNLGLERVATPYVLFWDADDLMCPGILGLLEARLDAEPGAVGVAAGILEDEPRVPHRWPRPWARRLAGAPTPFALLNCVWSIYPTTGATLLRTDAVRAAGGFGDASSGEDWALGAALAFRGRLLFETRPGRIYRRHADSLWEKGGHRADLIRNSAAVRARLREDAGVPAALRATLPAVAALQRLAIDGLRPLVRLTRRQ